MGLYFPRLRSPVRVSWATNPRNFLASYLVSMISRVIWSPEGLVEVRVSWPGHPRYKKKTNKQTNKQASVGSQYRKKKHELNTHFHVAGSTPSLSEPEASSFHPAHSYKLWFFHVILHFILCKLFPNFCPTAKKI